MYKFVKSFKVDNGALDERGNKTTDLGYQTIVIDWNNAMYIQNTYHIMSTYYDKEYGHVFRDTQELRQILKLLKIEEDK